MVRLLAERYDTKSNVKLGGFPSQLQASYVSSHNEELWYKEEVCLWMTIYIYIYIVLHPKYLCKYLCIRLSIFSKFFSPKLRGVYSTQNLYD